MKPMVFVLSTGRTGTSYVADILKRACDGQVEAHHERLTSQACARRFFRRYDLLEKCRNVPAIKEMLESIHETTTRVPYIDTGWTLHSLLPLFLQEFSDQVRLVMQLRHPFDSAASLAVRGVYHERAYFDDWAAHCFLQPGDNAFRSDVSWATMSPFEKNLWRWAELVMYWDELKSRFPRASFHVVRCEDLFANEACLALFFKLLELPIPPVAQLQAYSRETAKNENSIDLQCWFGIGQEWKRYFDYPWVLETAQRYGYTSDATTLAHRVPKYVKPSSLVRLRAGLRRVWRRYRAARLARS